MSGFSGNKAFAGRSVKTERPAIRLMPDCFGNKRIAGMTTTPLRRYWTDCAGAARGLPFCRDSHASYHSLKRLTPPRLAASALGAAFQLGATSPLVRLLTCAQAMAS